MIIVNPTVIVSTASFALILYADSSIYSGFVSLIIEKLRENFRAAITLNMYTAVPMSGICDLGGQAFSWSYYVHGQTPYAGECETFERGFPLLPWVQGS
jgi:hypothetical protein